MRAGSATVRPTEGSENVLGMGSFDVNNNTQLGLTLTWMATGNIGIELLAATPYMSVWYMDIDTEVKFKAAGQQQNIDTRIDPWVFFFGVGYRF